jgi:hypothetical protein
VLTAESWWGYHLAVDAEARDWLDRAVGAAPNSYWAFHAVLVGEGIIDVFVWPRGARWLGYFADEHHVEIITIRRRYNGPVPPQVLAAFEPERNDARVRFP